VSQWSLALIGNDSAEKAETQRSWSDRVISDKETRRKPLVLAAGAAMEKERELPAKLRSAVGAEICHSFLCGRSCCQAFCASVFR